jgi:hypothetical protein
LAFRAATILPIRFGTRIYWHLRRLPHWIPLPLDSITLGFHYPWILK